MTYLILLFLFTCTYKIKTYKKEIYNEEYLTMEHTTNIRGILALSILICHTLTYVEFSYDNKILNFMLEYFLSSGYLVVGIFFLFSGYGLMYGMKNKENYLEGFVYKRVMKIVIPYILTNIIYILVKILIGNKFSFTEMITSFFTTSIMPNSWYIVSIVIFYIGFWYILRKFDIKKSIAIIGLFTLLYMIVTFILGIGAWWYVSSISFFIGIVWAYKEQIYLKYIKHRYKYYTCITIIVFMIMYRLASIIELIDIDLKGIKIVEMILASVCFTVLFLLIIIKFKFGNRILLWYGKISLEIYLIHGLIIEVLNKFETLSKVEFLVLTVLISTICAYNLNNFYSKVINLWLNFIKLQYNK